MANTPNERTGQHTDGQMGAKQCSAASNHLSQKAPAGLGPGGHLPWGQATGPQSSVHKTVYVQVYCPHGGVSKQMGHCHW